MLVVILGNFAVFWTKLCIAQTAAANAVVVPFDRKFERDCSKGLIVYTLRIVMKIPQVVDVFIAFLHELFPPHPKVTHLRIGRASRKDELPGAEGPEAKVNVLPVQLLGVNLAAKGLGLLWSTLVVSEREGE